MFNGKSASLELLKLAKRVYQEVETFKNHLKSIELNRKIDRDIALLGEAMFRLRRQQRSFLDADPSQAVSISVLIDRIREDKNKFKNNYLLNSYSYISKLFNNVF